MFNHFHLLLEVPPMAERDSISDAKLVRRFRALYGADGTRYEPISADRLEAILANGGAMACRWRKTTQGRMHDLPLFMKLVKHRFTEWHNATHKTFGTFWAERYSSLLVETNPDVLCKLAYYIDFNPVRAGLVEDPALYPWSGYGAARMGNSAQHERLAHL